jgi:hypothetical protein
MTFGSRSRQGRGAMDAAVWRRTLPIQFVLVLVFTFIIEFTYFAGHTEITDSAYAHFIDQHIL